MHIYDPSAGETEMEIPGQGQQLRRTFNVSLWPPHVCTPIGTRIHAQCHTQVHTFNTHTQAREFFVGSLESACVI